MDPIVYTVALTPRARVLCDRLSESGLRMTHFEDERDLKQAFGKCVPAVVVIHGTRDYARTLQADLRQLPEAEKVGVITVSKLAPPGAFGDHDETGTAAAVMTVFDTMPELNDSDPWKRRPT